MKSFITIILFSALSHLMIAQEPEPVRLNPSDFNLSIEMEVYCIVVDVRLPMEYRKLHLPNARNIPNREQLKLFADTLDREMPVYMYCTTDTRSAGAAEYLISLGFVNVSLLEGGIREWQAYGLPLEGRRAERESRRSRRD